MDYLKKTEGCEGSIYEYFEGEPDPESLSVKLLDEFDRCILGYFAFHWDQATAMIDQVTSRSHPKRRARSRCHHCASVKTLLRLLNLVLFVGDQVLSTESEQKANRLKSFVLAATRRVPVDIHFFAISLLVIITLSFFAAIWFFS